MDDPGRSDEGIRILGAAGDAPSVGRAPAPRPAPTASWDEADEGWDDAWLSDDGDLGDHVEEAAAGRDATSLWAAPSGDDADADDESSTDSLADDTFDDDSTDHALEDDDGELDDEVNGSTAPRLISIDDDEASADGRSTWETYAGAGVAAARARSRGRAPLTEGRDDSDGDDPNFDDDFDSDDEIDDSFGPDASFDDQLDDDQLDDDQLDDDLDDDLDAPALGASPKRRRGPSDGGRADVAKPIKVGAGATALKAESGNRDRESAGNRRAPQGSRPTSGRPVSREPQTAKPSSIGSRIVTGVALIAVASVILKFGGARGAVALLTLFGALAIYELLSGLRQRGFHPAILPVALATLSLPFVAYNKGSSGILVVLVITLLVSMLWFLMGPARDRPTVNIAVSMLALFYVGFVVGLGALLVTDRRGLGVIVAVIVGCAAHDIAALFIGKNFGRLRVAPEVSPNKTLEGLVGGIVVAVLAVVVYGQFVSPFSDDLSATIAFAVIVGALAPLGDLVESMIKRDLGIKDMGSLLPGHGGVLDRIDAMLFVLPGAFLLALSVGWVSF